MNEVAKDIFNTTYEEIVDYFGVEGEFVKEEYSDHMKVISGTTSGSRQKTQTTSSTSTSMKTSRAFIRSAVKGMAPAPNGAGAFGYWGKVGHREKRHCYYRN